MTHNCITQSQEGISHRWPKANLPSNDPGNNCRKHFSSNSSLVPKVGDGGQLKETHGPFINNVHRPTALNRLHNTHKVMAVRG